MSENRDGFTDEKLDTMKTITVDGTAKEQSKKLAAHMRCHSFLY